MTKIKNYIRKRLKKLVVVGIILLILGTTVPKRARRIIEGPEFTYKTAAIEKKNISSVVSASGQIEAQDKATLQFQTGGKLSWVGVKEGDHVKKWQAIAQLDKKDLEERLLKTLRDYSKTRWDFEELHRVTYPNPLTDTVRRILDKSQFDLDKSVADVEIANEAMKLATLISPIDGVVTSITTPLPGTNITPASAVFVVMNPDKLKFSANIDETDISKIKIGQKASITLDALIDHQFKTSVNLIGFSSITTKGGGNAYNVEFAVENATGTTLRDGMNGDVDIIIEEREGVLVVPQSALARENGKTIVKIIENKKIKNIEVELGLETDTEAEVTGDISEGQKIIIGKR